MCIVQRHSGKCGSMVRQQERTTCAASAQCVTTMLGTKADGLPGDPTSDDLPITRLACCGSCTHAQSTSKKSAMPARAPAPSSGTSICNNNTSNSLSSDKLGCDCRQTVVYGWRGDNAHAAQLASPQSPRAHFTTTTRASGNGSTASAHLIIIWQS